MALAKAGATPKKTPKSAAAVVARAYVVLRPAAAGRGESGQGGVTHSYGPAAAAESTIQAANERLAKRGFQVSHSGPATIAIEGGLDLFREVFGAAVRSVRQPREAKGIAHQAPKIVRRFKSSYRIPPDLEPFIVDVVFPSTSTVHG